MSKLHTDIIFSCPTCISKIERNSNIFLCKKCKTEYPFITNSLPILIENPKNYLTNYLKGIEQEISLITLKIDAPKSNKKIVAVLKDDLSYLKTLKSEIIKYVTVNGTIENQEKKIEYGYFNHKEYLIRDWSNTEGSKKELQSILEPLRKEINKHSLKNKIAVVPGCGLGRISYEVSDIFKQIYSFDISLPMLYMTDLIKRKSQIVKKVNTRNVLFEKNIIETFDIDLKKITSKNKQNNIDNVFSFVGNACKTPFANNSVDAIISAYFSDTIPLNDYFEEFKRILKPGGVFIHFGPLDYHFNDTNKHYSLEKLFLNIEDYGFEIDKNYQLIETINSNNNLSIKGYHNILFSAIKKKGPVIGLNTKLYFDKPFEFNVKGTFKRDFIEDKKNSSILFYDESTYTNTETVFKILTVFKEGFSIKQIVEKLEKEFNLKGKGQEKAIIGLIHNLITKKVFKI